jgi:hypothetical protein
MWLGDEERREWARWAWETSWEWHAWGRKCTHLSHLIAQSRTRWYDLPYQIPNIIRIWHKGSYFFGYCHVTKTLYCWQYTQSWDRSYIHTYKIFVGNLERKRIPGIPRRRWEESMTMVLRETWYEVRDWIQDRDNLRSLMNAEMNRRTK